MKPDTIVLIHGFWVTPRSWEHWKARYEARGFRVLTPAYPGFEVEVEALNADPAPIESVTVPQIIESLETLVGGLDTPAHPHGPLGRRRVHPDPARPRLRRRCGVAINSAPTEGVQVIPISQLRATFPVLKNPANRHRAVGFTFDQWRYAFTNTFPEDEARATYERYHIPASGNIFWGSALANIHPGKDDNWVNYHNDDRAPLLFVSGELDNLMPPKVQRSNAKHYKSAKTDHRDHRVRGPRPPDARRARLGGDRRHRPRMGPRPRASLRIACHASSAWHAILVGSAAWTSEAINYDTGFADSYGRAAGRTTHEPFDPAGRGGGDAGHPRRPPLHGRPDQRALSGAAQGRRHRRRARPGWRSGCRPSPATSPPRSCSPSSPTWPTTPRGCGWPGPRWSWSPGRR